MATKKKKKQSLPKRSERRFVPQSSHNPWLVRVLGGLGAVTLGAGTWGYIYGHSFEFDEKLKALPQYLVAGGAILTGAAIWLGTSSEAPIRVGDPGIGVERGEVRRMPWWAVDQIVWESGTLALAISGTDETGTGWSFKVPLTSHAEAVSWIVEEAEERIPRRIDIPEEVRQKLPAASEHAGMKIDLEPLQVVGKKCAATGKTISYEPDARVCTRCERVYLSTAVPKKCKCGASLAHLRGDVEPGSESGESDEDDDIESGSDESSERESETASG